MGYVKTGAMIGGSFLPEKEFKEIIKELFDSSDNVLKIRNILNTIIKYSDNPQIIYNNIEKLETEIFKNPATSLLLIANLDDPLGHYTWSYNYKESKLLDKGYLKYTKMLKKDILAQKYSQFLSEHLLDLINYIEHTKLKNDEIDDYFAHYSFKSAKIKSELGKKVHDNGGSLLNAVYGMNPTYKGQIADAFLNHLGNKHNELFLEKGIEIEKITPFKKSVKEEEGSHFLQLLLDSTNSTGWQTGGDLILVSNNQVVANIQLKTILNENGQGQKIKTDNIVKQVQKLRDFIDKDLVYNKDKFADIMWDFLNTSAIFDKISKTMTDDAVKIVKQKLNLKT